ncbi:DNA (cytosine-5)-methyltransferase 1-like [Pieris brassicae]|uniref:DNA (cytosine-5)-methyltransferase 1-like n=1 Tax=Pieris brassicae TaxID=7116 RepID=UPI001E65E908|nr:DNA (cytosine-5)-methyltransferase 1-like [Pieris brassicae]
MYQPKITSFLVRKRRIIQEYDIENKKVKGNDIDQPEPSPSHSDPKYRSNDKDSIVKKTEKDIQTNRIVESTIIHYEGYAKNAIEEIVALAHEKLLPVSGSKENFNLSPHTNITGFSLYNQNGDLVEIDREFVNRDEQIYLAGYLKSLNLVSPEVDENCIPVKHVGPILAWFISGFAESCKNRITLSTKNGDYSLLKPSSEYMALMNNLYEKIWMCKVVVEFLQENEYIQPTYEDLLSIICQTKIPDLNDLMMSEEMLHKHAQFLCDQIAGLECEEDCEPLIKLPCMRTLVKLIGIEFRKENIIAKINYKKCHKKSWSKATTTPLIQKTFENFFTKQLDIINNETVLMKSKCGVCGPCQRPDCGKCRSCRTMPKFGGTGTTTQICIKRRCPNIAIQEAELSDEEHKQHIPDKARSLKREKIPLKISNALKNIKWIGDAIQVDATKVYYEKVKVDGVEYSKGDFVMIQTRLNIPPLVTRIVYMWKDIRNSNKCYFHAEVFMRSSATVLGEVGDPREVFLENRCIHGILLSSIVRKAVVEKVSPTDDWFQQGGKDFDPMYQEDDGKTFFYRKFYNRFTARFEDLPPDPTCRNSLRIHRFCPSCERTIKLYLKEIPRVTGKLSVNSDNVKETDRTEWASVKWRDYEYKKGCGVFLRPGTFKLRNNINLHEENATAKGRKSKKPNVDEDIYPEHYRKQKNHVCGSNNDTKEPFCVGYIVAVTVASYDHWLVAPQDIKIKLNVLYRPENTSGRFPHREDINLVYWSEEIREVPFSTVMGPCHLSYVDNIPQTGSIYTWLEEDPNRIYFKMSYDKKTDRVKKVPEYARAIGCSDQGSNDKGKGKGKSSKPQLLVAKVEKDSIRPLRSLDVFAGCGGLSEGLRQSGVAECKWAIENDEATAHAFSLNNQQCKVFNEDCNILLKDILSGATHSSTGVRLPMKGEVELLCGGPPCQGFSGMNRFNSREYSDFQNSLIASFLAYCDYYRPKYFILENVRNFVAFKKGMVLKLTLKALLNMGYQFAFGILQAGSYGVPQTRRRLIIFAAAPGCKLPLFPEPTNVFSGSACFLTSTIDGKTFESNIKWCLSAPRRTCIIRDAMSDLPFICYNSNEKEMDYGTSAESYFQRLVRSREENAKLRDHTCKKMAPLVQARIDRIPTKPGSDWRDLPNISATLSDGTKSNVLNYRYEDKKHGRSSTGAMRGICACASGQNCNKDKQENTLIPWCLPHTANRHNNWAGLYGRIAWDGYFSTTVTDPEPMGKQGRVLHPDQNRVVSVRECARSQGFPDTYILTGSVMDKHRQIGNAVPPPLAAALGREIKKVLKP